MKKKFFIGASILVAIICLALTFSFAPVVVNNCVGGTSYLGGTVYPVMTTKLDTIVGTGTDTFRCSVGCNLKSITFQNDFYKIGGSPVCTVNLYASSNGGVTYSTSAITTYTVGPTSTSLNTTPAQTIVNGNFGGNPYTHYMWVMGGTASTTLSWQSNITTRQ